VRQPASATAAVTPDIAHQTLLALHPTAGAQLGTLCSLLQRTGPQAPDLLALGARLPGLPGLPDGVAQLQAALPALTGLHAGTTADGQPLAWAEPPTEQVQRVLNALLAGARGQPAATAAAASLAHGHARQFGLSPHHADHAARAAAASMQWLADAAASADADLPFNDWAPAKADGHCLLPLALLDGAGNGMAGWLQLWRVRSPGARLCLAPAPASTLLLRSASLADIARGATWDAALAQVNDRLHLLLSADAGGWAGTTAAGQHPLGRSANVRRRCAWRRGEVTAN
jgi:hypothetical protein